MGGQSVQNITNNHLPDEHVLFMLICIHLVNLIISMTQIDSFMYTFFFYPTEWEIWTLNVDDDDDDVEGPVLWFYLNYSITIQAIVYSYVEFHHALEKIVSKYWIS